MRITVPTSANATAIEHPNNCMRHLILFYPIGVVWANSPHTTKQNKRLRERESKEHRMFVRPFVVGGFRRRAAAENMWAVAESCFASVIPKRLTHTNTESLSLARTLSRHFALYFSLLVLVFMPSPHQEKTCSRRIECLARRIECHAFCGVLRRQFDCDRYNVKFSVRNSLYVIVVVIAVSFVFVFDAFNCCYCAHPTSSSLLSSAPSSSFLLWSLQPQKNLHIRRPL